MACRGGSFGALVGQGGGNTGGMNQGNPPVGGPEGSAPGTPPAVCSSRACNDSSFTPAKTGFVAVAYCETASHFSRNWDESFWETGFDVCVYLAAEWQS